MEDVAIATGLMANAGIKGTQAGTSLRALMTRLASPTKESATAMDALGIAIDDGEGNLKSLMELMQDLRQSFGSLKISQQEFEEEQRKLNASFEAGQISEEEYTDGLTLLMKRAYGAEGAMKAEYAAMLAGKNGLSGFLAIVNASDEDFYKLTESIYGSAGAAEQMANVKLDNLQGDITLLKSNIEGTANSIGEKFMPMLRAAAQAANYVVTAFNTKGIEGAVDVLTKQIGGLGSFFSADLTRLSEDFVNGFNTAVLGIVKLAQNALPTVTGRLMPLVLDGMQDLVDGIIDDLPSLAGEIASAGESLFIGLLDGRNHTAERLKDAIPETLARLSTTITVGIPKMLDSAMDLFGTIVSGLGSALNKLLPMIPPMIANIAASVKQHLPELLNTITSVVSSAVRFVAENLSDAVSGAGEIIGIITDNLLSGGNLEKLVDAALELISAAANTVLTNLPKLFDGAGDVIAQIGTFLSKNLPKVISTAVGIIGSLLREVPAKLLPALMRMLPKLQKVVQEILPAVLNSLADQLPLIYSAVADLLTYTAEALRDNLPTVTKMLAENISEALPVLYESFAAVIMALSQVFTDQEVMNALISTIPVLAQAVADTMSAYAPIYADMVVKLGKTVIKSIPTLIPALLNVMAALELPFVQWLGTVTRNARDTIRTSLENLLTRMERGAKDAIRGFFEFFGTLPERLAYFLGLALSNAINFATDFPEKATDAAKAFVEHIKEGVKELPDRIAEVLRNITDKVGQWKNDLGNKAREAADNMKNTLNDTIRDIPQKFEGIGKQIVYGLWRGINDKGNWLRDNLMSYCSNIVDAFKRGFDIHSPSRKMRDTVGNNLALGIAEGFMATMRRVSDQMIASIPTSMLAPQEIALAGNSYAMAAASYTTSEARQGSGNVYNINISVENARIDSSQSIRDTAEQLADETQKALAGKGKW